MGRVVNKKSKKEKKTTIGFCLIKSPTYSTYQLRGHVGIFDDLLMIRYYSY